MTDLYTDGNALAGPLTEIFAADMSMAERVCAHCGDRGVVARLHVYDHAPGVVARCPTCQGVNIRLVRANDRAWLDLRGVVSLEIPLSATDV
ncbi:DUF6510 family protein [Asanoa sp. NPDC049518]|uniref:DUF6510 family protein n=1 Tax=unclassified Asanoa TaxID=2685164 RepID=UPI0034399E74